MSPGVLQFIATCATVLACGCAVFVAVRAGRWRSSDAFKAILERLARAERWQESEQAKAMMDRITSCESTNAALTARLGVIEDDIKHLPTKADLERVEGEVRSVGRQVASVDAGIDRLEGYFLKRGVDAVTG